MGHLLFTSVTLEVCGAAWESAVEQVEGQGVQEMLARCLECWVGTEGLGGLAAREGVFQAGVFMVGDREAE